MGLDLGLQKTINLEESHICNNNKVWWVGVGPQHFCPGRSPHVVLSVPHPTHTRLPFCLYMDELWAALGLLGQSLRMAVFSLSAEFDALRMPR